MIRFTTKVGEVTERPDGIILLEYAPNKVSLDEMREHMATMDEKFPNRKRLVFIDARNVKSAASKEMRDYLAHDEKVVHATLAVAALVGSGVARIAGNLILSFNKPSYPFRMFSNEKKAIQWLKSQGAEAGVE